MPDQKRSQNTPQKSDRESGQQGAKRGGGTQRQGQQNPEPHKKGTGSGKPTRKV